MDTYCKCENPTGDVDTDSTCTYCGLPLTEESQRAQYLAEKETQP